MKGIVLEIKDGHAAVLTDQGTVISVDSSGKGYTVGQEIVIEENGKKTAPEKGKVIRLHRVRRIIAAAACLALALGITFSYYTTSVKACSYVSIEMVPSLEYGLNRYGKVVSVSAQNEEAEPLVQELLEQKVEGMDLTSAINVTYEALKEQGYLENADSAIVLSVASDDSDTAQSLSRQIESSVLSAAGDEVKVFVSSTDIATRNAALEASVSTGRYLAEGYGETLTRSELVDGELVEASDPLEGDCPGTQTDSEQETSQDAAVQSGTASDVPSHEGEQADPDAQSQTESNTDSGTDPASTSDIVPQTDSSESIPSEGMSSANMLSESMTESPQEDASVSDSQTTRGSQILEVPSSEDSEPYSMPELDSQE